MLFNMEHQPFYLQVIVPSATDPINNGRRIPLKMESLGNTHPQIAKVWSIWTLGCTYVRIQLALVHR